MSGSSFTPNVSTATLTPTVAGAFDQGSATFPYRSEFLTEQQIISPEDTAPVETDLGAGGLHVVGLNDGMNLFNGMATVSAYDGNWGILNFSRTNATDLAATVAVAPGDVIGLIAPWGSDGANYAINAEATFEVDDTVAAGDIPTKLGWRTGAGGNVLKAEHYLRSSGILETNAQTDFPLATSRQYAVGGGLTNNATPTSIVSFTLEDEAVYHFRSAIKGRFRDLGTDKGVVGFLEFSVYRNNGGNATLFTTPFKGLQDLGASGYDFDAVVSGNDVEIEVTGAAGETVDWTTDTVWSAAGN